MRIDGDFAGSIIIFAELPQRRDLPFNKSIVARPSMNNEQFRRLVFDNPSTTSSVRKERGSVGPPRHQNEDLAIGGTSRTTALGSRIRSSIPMTPYVYLFR